VNLVEEVEVARRGVVGSDGEGELLEVGGVGGTCRKLGSRPTMGVGLPWTLCSGRS
jgi:hypothetical protein